MKSMSRGSRVAASRSTLSARSLRAAALALAAGWALTPVALAQPVSTAFTYQGDLQNDGAPADGAYDLRFRLFDAAAGGSQVGSTLCVDNVQVVDGKFTALLDFGAQFGGQQRFLDIQVRADTGQNCGVTTGYTLLSPRQSLTATPYATFAPNAGAALNSSQLNGQSASFYQNAGNLTTGTLPDARIGSNVVRTGNSNSFTGTNSFSGFSSFLGNVDMMNPANNFGGNGSGLIGLNASNIAGGTLGDARLSTNVALRNAANTFTEPNTFGAGAFLNGFVGVNTTQNIGSASMVIRGSYPGAAYNGFYVESPSTDGWPFVGYATNGQFRAWTSYDGATNEWSLINYSAFGGTPVMKSNGSGNMIFARNVGINTGATTPGAGLHVASNGSGVGVFTGDLGPFGAAGFQANYSAGAIGSSALIYLAVEGGERFSVFPNGDGFFSHDLQAGGIIASSGSISSTNGNVLAGSRAALDQTGSNTGWPEARLSGIFGDPLGLSVEVGNSYSIVNLDNNFRMEGRSNGARGGMVRIDGRDASFGLPLFQFWHKATLSGTENQVASIDHLGNFAAAGSISAPAKFFRIDHPDDPANKTLRHACIESDEYKNIYDGVVTTDGTGYATITLPSWMTSLNENFRYQLTVIDEADSGDPLLWARVVRRLDDSNTFVIRTSAGGTVVSWQVTGTRKDAWAKANPFSAEANKVGPDQGRYLSPESFGKPLSESVFSGEASTDRTGQSTTHVRPEPSGSSEGGAKR